MSSRVAGGSALTMALAQLQVYSRENQATKMPHSASGAQIIWTLGLKPVLADSTSPRSKPSAAQTVANFISMDGYSGSHRGFLLNLLGHKLPVFLYTHSFDYCQLISYTHTHVQSGGR